MVKLTGSHSGPLNVKVAFSLNGVAEGSAQDLIDLMRSKEQIDRTTRDAIANALERRSGVRLEFHRGNDAPLVAHLDTALRYQDIADDVEARVKATGVEKTAKVDAGEAFGVSPRTVNTALKRRRSANFRVSKVPRGGRFET